MFFWQPPPFFWSLGGYPFQRHVPSACCPMLHVSIAVVLTALTLALTVAHGPPPMGGLPPWRSRSTCMHLILCVVSCYHWGWNFQQINYWNFRNTKSHSIVFSSPDFIYFWKAYIGSYRKHPILLDSWLWSPCVAGIDIALSMASPHVDCRRKTIHGKKEGNEPQVEGGAWLLGCAYKTPLVNYLESAQEEAWPTTCFLFIQKKKDF